MKLWPEKYDAYLPLPKVARTQILFTMILTCIASLIIYVPNFPFDKRFGLVALLSGTIHLVLCMFYNKIKYIHLFLVHFVNIVMLGFSVHYTGGISSPFTGIFACVLIAGTASEVRHPLVMPLIMGVYTSVIALEYFGIIQPVKLTALDIYKSNWTTLLIVLAILGFLAISGKFYDVITETARKRIESEQDQKQKLIRKMGGMESSSQLGIMVAKITHDLHGPLTAISGFVQLMKGNPTLDQTVREDCEIIYSETQRISGMIEKMLRYVKPGTEAKEKISPINALETVLAVIQFHPKAKGVRFQKDFHIKEDLQILGNVQSLQQVYFNIIKNALEAMEKQKERRITVSATTDSTSVNITITDNGPGMNKELIEKVKGGFYSNKDGGTGFGLTIVSEIIKGHSGIFEIQSEPGQGTKMSTKLPIHACTQQPELATHSLAPTLV